MPSLNVTIVSAEMEALGEFALKTYLWVREDIHSFLAEELTQTTYI